MDAFLDNFGGSAGKDLLIREQELSHHYSKSNVFGATKPTKRIAEIGVRRFSETQPGN